jgi:hypothetical protein
MDRCARVDDVIERLRHRGQVSSQALKAQVRLDDEALEGRTADLPAVRQIALERAGAMPV